MPLLAGEYDVGLPPRNAAEYANRFEHAALAVQPGDGHFPGSMIPCDSRGHWRLFPAARVDQQRRGHRRPVSADRARHGSRSCAGLGGQGRPERG